MNVNVADGDPVDKLTVVGLNVPATVDAGVIVVVDAVPPEGVNVTVKFVLAALTLPLEGPVKL